MTEPVIKNTDNKEAGSIAKNRHKGGAPRKQIRREKSIRVRLTINEHFLIDRRAKSANMRISDWFRSAAIKAKVVARISARDRIILHTLTGLANNLNQLTKLAYAAGISAVAVRCIELLSSINKLIHKLFENNENDNQNV